MGVRKSYEPGTFCWADLSTADVEGAKAFYGDLLGWEFRDDEIPGGGTYTMCYVGGDDVAAMVEQNQQPGHWNHYVSVESAGEPTAEARRLGATVLEEPFDVMDVGRMAMLSDPDGAMFCVWEARGHAGAARVNDPGCMTWNELQPRQPDEEGAFYARLSWAARAATHAAGSRAAGARDGARAGGMPCSELRARHPDEAAAFYAGLFGWGMEPIKEGGR